MTEYNDMGVEVKESNFVEFELIPVGKYYFSLHGIVGLGQRDMSHFIDKKGNPQTPVGQVRLIFELLNHKREDGQNSVINCDLTVTTGDKGNLKAFVACLLDRFPSDEEMRTKYVSVGIEELLGSVGRLTISHSISKKTGNTYAKVETKNWGFSPVDEYTKPQLPKALRETFFFNPMNKEHVEVYKKNLTYKTQKDIMEALNVNQFPEALHLAWKEIELKKVVTNKEIEKVLKKKLEENDDIPFDEDHNDDDAYTEDTIG